MEKNDLFGIYGYRNSDEAWVILSALSSGWFQYCNGIIVGRPDGYENKRDFTLIDALEQGLGDLNVQVLYDADIGHIPPQIQVVNGSIGKV